MNELLLVNHRINGHPSVPETYFKSGIAAENLIGRGRTADVYAWGENKVLKLFHSGWRREAVEREANLSRAVSSTGLAVPRVDAGLVQIGERFGIVFEQVAGPSMLRLFAARPWTMPGLVRTFSGLHVVMHTQHAPSLLSQREHLLNSINRESGQIFIAKVERRRFDRP